MASPTLTVLTPSLNHGRFIGEAVDSVRLLGATTWEHLVVDADSTDETHKVLAARPWIKLHVKPELDSHEALNFGIEQAQGDVIAFLNCDDRYEDGALDAVMEVFATRPEVEAVAGGMRFFIEQDGVEKEMERFFHLNGDELRLELTFGNPGFNSWFVRSRLLRRLRGFRTYYRMAADRDLLLRLAAVTTPFALPRLVYHYRMHEGSRTMDPRGTNKLRMIHEHLGLAQEQAEQVWTHDRAMLDLLANWAALERFKLVARAVRYGDSPLLGSVLRTPWHRVPAALALRRRWLRLLFPDGRPR